jgi:hypothetical protein
MSNAALTQGTGEARADAGADSHAWRRAPQGARQAIPRVEPWFFVVTFLPASRTPTA